MEASRIYVLVSALLWAFCSVKCLNNRPIIGIVAEETYVYSKSFAFGNSSIMSSYIKFVESGGARVVPIMIHKSQDHYRDLMSKINGVLFPGGGVPLTTDGYGRTVKMIYDIAVEMNDNGDYFPLWGTCLGFEALNYFAAKQKDWMTACLEEDLASNINLQDDSHKTRMYRNADDYLVETMMHGNVTINYHQWCMTRENYTLSGLNKFFKILSINQDSRNESYISSIEAYNYPFYGVTFHPEKVLFEWVLSETHKNIPHTRNATLVSQYFANFFVDEARKSSHTFPSKASEDAVLIYNYQPTFTGKLNMSTEQYYYFP